MSDNDINHRYKSIEDKLSVITEYATEHPDFDTEFVDSLNNQFERKGDLSDKQILALSNIIDKWEMDP